MDILNSLEFKNIDLNIGIKGYKIYDSEYLGVIPASSLEGYLWNIETLSDFIGEQLPDEAIIF